MIVVHVEHAQKMRQGWAWCGEQIVGGPRVIGLDNFLYHSEDQSTGPICKACIRAILEVVGSAIQKTVTHGG